LIEGIQIRVLRTGRIQGADPRDVGPQFADLVNVSPVFAFVTPAHTPRSEGVPRGKIVFAWLAVPLIVSEDPRYFSRRRIGPVRQVGSSSGHGDPFFGGCKERRFRDNRRRGGCGWRHGRRREVLRRSSYPGAFGTPVRPGRRAWVG